MFKNSYFQCFRRVFNVESTALFETRLKTIMGYSFKDVYKSFRDELIRTAGQSVVIYRDSLELARLSAVFCKTVTEDVDATSAYVLTSYVDIIFSTDDEYIPRSGDIIESEGARYVVKKLASELYKVNGARRETIRAHAQALGDVQTC